MAKLKDRVQNVLMESRMFVLAGNVLFGFQLKAHFKEEWPNLPAQSKYVLLFALCTMTLAMVLLILPTQFHRLAERGQDTRRLQRLAAWTLVLAGIPFSASMSADLFVITEQTFGNLAAAWVISVGAFAVAMTVLYGVMAYERRRRRQRIEELKMGERDEDRQQEREGTDIKTRINHVLTELRVVLPGATALLGFQFVVFLSTPFHGLPEVSKFVHFGSALCIATATLMLVSPAAYHRLVERGEETEHFHRFASRVIVFALIPLGLGIAGDFYVVTRKVLEAPRIAAWSSAGLLALMYTLWFAVPLTMRRKRDRQARMGVRNPLTA